MKSLNIQDLYKLSYITRYSNVERIKDESVAEHSYFVSIEIMDLYQKFDFDLGRALQMAITHDIPEVFTDDVNHLIKKKYPQLAIELKKAEQEEIKQLPEYIQRSINEYEDQNSFEAIICHVADAKQCIQYSTNEINRGNAQYMCWVKESSQNRVKELLLDIYKHFPEKVRKEYVQ
jgi:5'-deoxynucleotidase YfbR-like HD superfamily hydrolase